MWEKNHSAFLIFQKICKKINKINYISDIFWTFKSKLQIIHGATYIALFLPDSSKCLFYIFSTIHLYLSLPFFHFVFLFLPSFFSLHAMRHILQVAMFDLISLQPVGNITEIKKPCHSPQRKKKCRVNYNQNKYSNIIIFGTKYKLFLPPYQITFFLAFSQAKILFSYHILINTLIYTFFCDRKFS